METIEWLITIVLVIISILGILLVLIQSSKGGAGGLFGDAGGSQSVIGSERRGDFFSRMTAIFLGIFIGGSFLLAYLRYQNNPGNSSRSSQRTLNTGKPKKSDGSKPKETSQSDKSDRDKPKEASQPDKSDRDKPKGMTKPIKEDPKDVY